jgi:hypothetical protein
MRKRTRQEIVPTFFLNSEDKIVEVAYTTWDVTKKRDGTHHLNLIGETSVSDLPDSVTRIVYETSIGCIGHAARIPQGWTWTWGSGDGYSLPLEQCEPAKGFAAIITEPSEVSG